MTDADGNVAYECDEVQFSGLYTPAYVEKNEDELWRLYNKTPINERMAKAEGISAEHDDAIIDLFEMLIGE